MAQKPGGTKFRIEVLKPPKPATSHALVMDEELTGLLLRNVN